MCTTKCDNLMVWFKHLIGMNEVRYSRKVLGMKCAERKPQNHSELDGRTIPGRETEKEGSHYNGLIY